MELTEGAVDELFSMIQGINGSLSKIADILTVITITYQENTPPRGKWLRYDADNGSAWECSECHNVWQLRDGTPAQKGMNYCPTCGAIVRE